MDAETMKVKAFDLLYNWAIDGDRNEEIRYEILAMGALIDELAIKENV